MDRDRIVEIVNFLRQVSEDFSTTTENLESCLAETTDQVVMAAEDDLENLQATLTEMMDETQNVLSLISEILP